MLALRGMEVLAEMPADALRSLAERSEEAVFGPGEVLCREGESGDWVYLIVEGQAEAVKKNGDGEVWLGFCQPGECVGELAALGDPGPRTATVRALAAPVRVLIVPGDEFRHLLGRNPAASLRVMRLIINRQRREPHGA